MYQNFLPRCVASALLGGLGFAQAPVHTFNGDQPDDVFGTSVAAAGDVNNDGFPDIIVGAPEDNAPFSQEDGYVRIYSGQNGSIIRTIDGGVNAIGFGHSVAGAGDVNNDGFDDVVVGAPFAGNGGQIFVYSGQDGSQLFTFFTSNPAALLGMAVSGAGDVNNDGFDDVIVGAPRYGTNLTGRIWILAGPNGSTLRSVTGGANWQLGTSVAGAGDVNNDGKDEVIVGSLTGGVRVYTAVPNSSPIFTFTSPWVLDAYGSSVASAGDINGDQIPEFIIGATQDMDFFFPGEGYVDVRNGATGAVMYTFPGDTILDSFGYAVSTAGDFDGDGTIDVLVGASQVFAGGDGYARVFSGATGTELLSLTGTNTHDRYGTSLAGLGDIDGDLAVEIAVGAPTADPNSLNAAGSVQIFSGTPGSTGGGCNDPIQYCTTSPNSVGAGGTMLFGGSTSIQNNDFVIAARGLPNFTQGLFIQGNNSIVAPFGDGVRCVDGPLFIRLDPINTTSGQGVAIHPIDYNQPQLPSMALTSGSTWYFQFWYRDPSSGSFGFNFTNGLQATFCP